MSWQPPNLTLRWGDYFHPDADDDTKLVKMTVEAKTAGIIDERTAVQAVARTFRIENVDEHLKALKKERDERQELLADAMHSMKDEDDEQVGARDSVVD